MMTTNDDRTPAVPGPAAGTMAGIGSVEDLINGMKSEREMRADIESVVLAPAWAVLASDPSYSDRLNEVLDQLLLRILGPTFDTATRLPVAVDLLVEHCLRAAALFSGPGGILVGMPDVAPGASAEWAESVRAAGDLLMGAATQDHGVLAKGTAVMQRYDSTARDIVLALSMFLAGQWRQQIHAHTYAHTSFVASLPPDAEEFLAPGRAAGQ
jgi:hypothetical protein